MVDSVNYRDQIWLNAKGQSAPLVVFVLAVEFGAELIAERPLLLFLCNLFGDPERLAMLLDIPVSLRFECRALLPPVFHVDGEYLRGSQPFNRVKSVIRLGQAEGLFGLTRVQMFQDRLEILVRAVLLTFADLKFRGQLSTVN